MFFANGLSQHKLNNDRFIEADENVFVSKTQYWIFLVPESSKIGTGSFPGVERLERGFEHPPHIAPKLKKE